MKAAYGLPYFFQIFPIAPSQNLWNQISGDGGRFPGPPFSVCDCYFSHSSTLSMRLITRISLNTVVIVKILFSLILNIANEERQKVSSH